MNAMVCMLGSQEMDVAPSGCKTVSERQLLNVSRHVTADTAWGHTPARPRLTKPTR